jgi:hypothetical protein
LGVRASPPPLSLRRRPLSGIADEQLNVEATRRLPRRELPERYEVTIMLLGGVAWLGSHKLDPAQPLSSRDPALNVQAVVSTHSGKPFAQR